MCANLAILPELSNYWEPPGLWTLVWPFSALRYICYAKDWAFIYIKVSLWRLGSDPQPWDQGVAHSKHWINTTCI